MRSSNGVVQSTALLRPSIQLHADRHPTLHRAFANWKCNRLRRRARQVEANAAGRG